MSSCGHHLLVIIFSIILTFALLISHLDAGGCSDEGSRGLCCSGRNNSCSAKGPRLNHDKHKTCFCDSYCLKTGDCCLDYANTCPAIDCVLSDDWNEWSECSTKCGIGIKERRKTVLVEAENGGKACDKSVQKVACDGNRCKVARNSAAQELKERGRIIPAQFATWRRDKKYDPFQDIRKNLFEHYGTVEKEEDRSSYCATYEVTDVHGSCSKSSSISWSKRLTRGATLCVECQPFSMKKELGGRCNGHGVYMKSSHWKAVAVPGCHGKWTMTSHHQMDCSCNPKDELSFVFV